MKYGILIAALVMGGCAYNPALSPEQITAASKDKSAAGNCVQITTPWGPQFFMSTNVDKGVVGTIGSASIKCGASEATFTNGVLRPQQVPLPTN